MGSTYGNVMVIGADVDTVASHVPAPAFVCNVDDVVMVFAAADDSVVTTAETLAALPGYLNLTTYSHILTS
jgi:hypothetical protein